MSDSTQLPLFDPISIQLTQGYVAYVDPIDADLADFKWSALVTDNGLVYATRGIDKDNKKSTELMHRVILSRMLKRILYRRELTDHKDTNGLNNTRQNLRLASQSQNLMNVTRFSNNKTGFKGVSIASRSKRQTGPLKWRADINIDGERKYLGLFDTPESAFDAYCKAAVELHGDFARTK